MPDPDRDAGQSRASHKSYRSMLCIYSVQSILSILSVNSAGSILSIGSAGSILSIGSAGGILSIGRRAPREAPAGEGAAGR